MNRLDTRALFFPGNTFVSHVFTAKPWIVFLIACGVSLLGLHLPAWRLGLGDVLNRKHQNVGFFHKYNWSLVYPLLIPLLLGLGAYMFQSMREAVYDLFNRPWRIITKWDGKAAEDYPTYISGSFAYGALWLEGLAALLAICVTAKDTSDLWPGFFRGGGFPATRIPEWDTAFSSSQFPNPPCGRWANFWFDIDAYLFQTAITFLGILFLVKCWTFLKLVADNIDSDRPPYRFNPLIFDLDRRLGLRPLGWVFNVFLAIIVLFQAYGFYHRIELIDAFRGAYGTEKLGYLSSIVRDVQCRMKDKDIFRQAYEVLKLPANDYAWLELRNPSTWLPLAFTVPPILAVCVLPLGRVFVYVNRERRKLIDDNRLQYETAMRNGDEDAARKIEAKLKALNETSVWPNGSRAGSVFLVLMVTLVAGTVCPPVIIWGIAGGILLKLFLWSMGERSKE